MGGASRSPTTGTPAATLAPIMLGDAKAPSVAIAGVDDATGPATPTRRRAGRHLWPLPGPWATVAVVVVYLGLAFLFYGRMWTAGASSVVQPGGDQTASVWFLEWVPFAITHGHDPFFTTFVNAPFGVNLLTNTSVPLLGLVGAPVTWLFGPVATFNLWCTLALAGSATAGYAFVRRWVAWRPAAFVGGLLYGFSPYQLAQSNGEHLNLTFVVLPPLVLLVAHEVLVRQQRSARRWGIVLGLLLAAQFFLSSEILVSTVVMAAVCTVATAVIGRRALRSRLGHALVGLGWAAGVAAVLLAYPAWFALRGPGSIRGPIQLVPQAYRADLLGPVVPSHFVWLAPASLVRVSDSFANSTVENGSYLGITLLVTLAVGVVALWRTSVPVRVAAVGGVAAFVISLGAGPVVRHAPGAVAVGFPLPERLFTKVSLLANTVPVRYSLYVTLFAGLVLALVLDRVRAAMAARSAPAPDLVGTAAVPDGTTPSGAGTTPVSTASTAATAAPGAGAGPAEGTVAGPRSRLRKALPTGVPVVLALVCLLPVVPNALPSGFWPVAAPGVLTSRTSPVATGSTTLLYPYPSGQNPRAQLWQAVSRMRFRTPGGYFLVPDGPDHHIGFSAQVGYGADTLTARTMLALAAGQPPAETPALRTALRAQLASWHVTSVVETASVDPDPARSTAFLTWLTGTRPAPVDGGRAWVDVDFGTDRSG